MPSAVTPLPQPTYGIPPGVAGSRSVYGGGGTISPSVRYRPQPKKRKKWRPRVSGILFIRTI
jgi:hypothetical protein